MTDFKVRLRGPNNEDVIFEASALLSERRDAHYDGYRITHLPTSIISYQSTSSRSFSITGKLISRTEQEAKINSTYLNRVRKWLLPEFGSTGASPPILKIYGYRNKNIDGKKVVLKSYDWNFPDDVDYIYTGTEPMPVIGSLNLSIEEVYSAEEVTSGAWKIIEDDTQSITNSGKTKQPDSDSFVLTWIGNGRYDPLRTTIPKNSVTSVMGALSKGSVTLPGVLAGSLARTIGNEVLKSSIVREISKKLPPVLDNIFISGAKIAIRETGLKTTEIVSSLNQIQSDSSGFKRPDELLKKKVVGE